MRPIALVLTLVLSLLAAPATWAQPASPTYRVGVLVPLPAAAANDLVQRYASSCESSATSRDETSCSTSSSRRRRR
jgi:hypothetical protein